ncbi:MAG: DinB family protein [Bacteroidia bacterium]
MKINNTTLIDQLLKITEEVLTELKMLSEMSEKQLQYKTNSESWSAMECIEHLNRYGDFYIPEIQRCLNSNQAIKGEFEFKSGVLGNYFANMMKFDTSKKMKTMNSMNPVNSEIRLDVLNIFKTQQELTLRLLNEARHFNLNSIRTKISISNLIKLRLGDTFRFVIYHNQRHMKQALKSASHFKE